MLNIDTSCWKEFRINELFILGHGKRLTKEDRIKGRIPFVTAGEQNCGIAEYIGNECELFSKPITIDMFGNCFYHDEVCAGDDNVYFFVNDKISAEAKLFISTIIQKKIKHQYSYAIQFRQKQANELTIKLPVTYVEEIDFELMEKYISVIEKITIKKLYEDKGIFINQAKKIISEDT